MSCVFVVQANWWNWPVPCARWSAPVPPSCRSTLSCTWKSSSRLTVGNCWGRQRWVEEGCVLPCSEALQQRLRLDLSSPARRCQTHVHVSTSSCVHHAEWLSCLCPRTDGPGLSHVLLGLQRRRLPAGTCGAAFRAGSSRELFRYVSRAEWTSWTDVSRQAKSAATVQFP